MEETVHEAGADIVEDTGRDEEHDQLVRHSCTVVLQLDDGTRSAAVAVQTGADTVQSVD